MAKREMPLLRRSSPEPLYRQLARHIETEIGRGALKLYDRLESEGLLAERFQVSRITVRQAVAELVRKQLLVRRQGKGTFVSAPAVRHDLTRTHGLLGSLFSQSEAAGSRLLRYELETPPADVATDLGLAPSQPALALDRLYLMGGRPVAFARAWLVPSVAALPRATAELLATEDMMRQVGIRIACSQVAMRAATAGAAVGRLLKIAARAPVLVLRRKTYGDDGAVKEVCCVSFCSDAYEFVCSTQSLGREVSLFDIRSVADG
jgi:GntR family transcriptional regulator